MRKPIFLLVGLVALLLGTFLAWRHGHSTAGDVDMAEDDKSPISTGNDGIPTKQSWSGPSATAFRARVRLSREVLPQGKNDAAEAKKPSPWALMGRDPAYEQLLAKQGRDQVKEEELLSRIMGVFGEKEDTSLGEVACSADFCRVELRASAGVDLIKKYGYDVHSALDPKGFNFAVFSRDAAGNPVTNFYFGRHDSWTAPDFHALGVL